MGMPMNHIIYSIYIQYTSYIYTQIYTVYGCMLTIPWDQVFVKPGLEILHDFT